MVVYLNVEHTTDSVAYLFHAIVGYMHMHKIPDCFVSFRKFYCPLSMYHLGFMSKLPATGLVWL